MTQKRIIAILLLCALTAACSKDESNGSSNGSTSSGTATHKYTYGYFHPVKKVQRIMEVDWSGEERCLAEFTWSGDNLQTIKKYPQSSEPTTYGYHYGIDGYIDCITRKDESRIHGDTLYYIYKNDEVREDYSYGRGIATFSMGYTFDADGNLSACNDRTVTYSTLGTGESTVTFYIYSSQRECLYDISDTCRFPLQGLIMPYGSIFYEGYLYLDAPYALKHTAIPVDATTHSTDDGFMTEIEYDNYTLKFIY